jgi:hypothetical protein
MRVRILGRAATAPRILRQLPREVRREMRRPKRRRSAAAIGDVVSLPIGGLRVGAFWR